MQTRRGNGGLWRSALGCFLLCVGFAASARAEGTSMPTVLFTDSAFSQTHCVWQPTAAREEIRPACAVDVAVSRTGTDGALRIGCTQKDQYGGWRQTVEGVRPGAWYRFDAYYRAEGVRDESRVVVARLDWRTADGGRERAGQPDYVYHTEAAGGGWKHVWSVAPAPETANSVRLELLFGWRPGGTVWWDDISLAKVDAPAPRKVRLATIHYAAKGNRSAAANVEDYCKQIDLAAAAHPDLIVLPEAMTEVGTGLTYAEVAEPIPGPTSERLGQEARKHHCYLVACYDERDGKGVYNTAILIDREGRIVGKYRKTYVPREEIEAGITPGEDTPVFDTDFGKVGMMICWDVEYPEPAQHLALKGAEIILMPIWDGDETLMRARAIENHVYLVTCAYGNPSQITDPKGNVLAEAKDGDAQTYAVTEIDLSQRSFYDPWLGDMRARFFKEHREDLQ